MDSLIYFIEIYTKEIIGVTVILSILCISITITNYRRTTKLMRKYKRLMRGADNKNLEAMLYTHLENLQTSMSRIKDIELKMGSMAGQLQGCIQRVGIVRYNAFDHQGGEQSFSIALMDNDGNGVVLTSLYGRNSSTAFAKPISNRKSTYQLTMEEEQAIQRAFNSK